MYTGLRIQHTILCHVKFSSRMATAENEESLVYLQETYGNYDSPALRSIPPRLRKAVIIVLVLEKSWQASLRKNT